LADTGIDGARIGVIAFYICYRRFGLRCARCASLNGCVAALSVEANGEFARITPVTIVIAGARNVGYSDVLNVRGVGLNPLVGNVFDVGRVTDFRRSIVRDRTVVWDDFGYVRDV